MKLRENQIVIGRQEYADFPSLELSGVPLKIDTGAYSSAIHCSRIEVNADEKLEVVFLEEGEPGFSGKTSIFKNFKTRRVKSSSGHTEVRFAVITKITVGEGEYSIRLTLTDRSAMRIPVLIGRKFLKINNFIVDPSLKHVFS